MGGIRLGARRRAAAERFRRRRRFPHPGAAGVRRPRAAAVRRSDRPMAGVLVPERRADGIAGRPLRRRRGRVRGAGHARGPADPHALHLVADHPTFGPVGTGIFGG